jgi:hypothetical protein
MRVRVSDVRVLPAFVSYLVRQGFPASACGRDEIEVLFPADPSAFRAAVELDDWTAQNSGVVVVPLPDLERA